MRHKEAAREDGRWTKDPAKRWREGMMLCYIRANEKGGVRGVLCLMEDLEAKKTISVWFAQNAWDLLVVNTNNCNSTVVGVACAAAVVQLSAWIFSFCSSDWHSGVSATFRFLLSLSNVNLKSQWTVKWLISPKIGKTILQIYIHNELFL